MKRTPHIFSNLRSNPYHDQSNRELRHYRPVILSQSENIIRILQYFQLFVALDRLIRGWTAAKLIRSPASDKPEENNRKIDCKYQLATNVNVYRLYGRYK